MIRSCSLILLATAVLLLAGCEHQRPKKPDATKGSVLGTVLCSDTGKPARFAKIMLVARPGKGGAMSDDENIEQGVTDLNGQFDLEAVRPGDYYAYATLPGYLDPESSVDFARVKTAGDDHAQLLDSIAQWREHLVEVQVRAHRASTISITIHRAAEINGTVTYDDGSPAIGMHFRVLRKNDQGEWHGVGLRLFGDWSLNTVSDDRGRYSIPGLPAGEYILCALLPIGDEISATPICYGNTLRPAKAASVHITAGEVLPGQDIVIPVDSLHTVTGTVSVAADGHAPTTALVRLLYADDRSQVRQTSTDNEGDFTFDFVPEGDYIVSVTNAEDHEENTGDSGSNTNTGNDTAQPPAVPRVPYADKDTPIQVHGELTGVSIQLAPKSAAPKS